MVAYTTVMSNYPEKFVETYNLLGLPQDITPAFKSFCDGMDRRYGEALMRELHIDVLPHAVTFDFSGVKLIADQRERALFIVKLAQEDLLCLPYPITFVMLSGGIAAVLTTSPKSPERIAMMIGMAFPIRSRRLGPKETGNLFLPMVFAPDLAELEPLIDGSADGKRAADLPINIINNMSFVEEHIAGTKTTGDTADSITQRFIYDMLWVVSCLGILMTPGVVVKEETAPERLNKTRILKGKPRINSRIKIFEGVDIKRAYEVKRGTHASPVPHFRRGHLRRLDEKRIVPVLPCVVGAENSELSEIGKKMYVYAQRKTGS